MQVTEFINWKYPGGTVDQHLLVRRGNEVKDSKYDTPTEGPTPYFWGVLRESRDPIVSLAPLCCHTADSPLRTS
jgi:hypothetical protein